MVFRLDGYIKMFRLDGYVETAVVSMVTWRYFVLMVTSRWQRPSSCKACLII
jgi:hypothetical protein